MEIIHKDDNKYKKTLKRFVFVTIGAMIIAFNLKSFVRTGGLFPGGFSGITLLVQQVSSIYFNLDIPYTAIYIPINMIPIYIGIKYLGKQFTFYSIYVIVLSSIMTDLIPPITITYDSLLIAIFGGLLNGIAISLCLFVGASAGGTDFISIYFGEKKGIDAWNYILMGNVVILATAGVLFGFDRALYSIIFQFVTTQIIQTLYKRYQKHTLWIITEQPSAVYARISDITHHDATVFKGTGCYRGVQRNMVYSVVGTEQVNRVLKEIKETDPKAFINVTKTEQVNGNFYKRPND